jgi:glutathione S-transferase
MAILTSRSQVPVLSSPVLKTPISESVDITYFLAERVPALCPPHLSLQIRQLLAELHDINYFSLTYTHKPQRASDMENSVLTLLSDLAISDRWREALKFKLDVYVPSKPKLISLSEGSQLFIRYTMGGETRLTFSLFRCRVRETRAPALAKEAVAVQESKASSFLAQIETLLAASEGYDDHDDDDDDDRSPWIFGTAEPTALDAHVVPFIARLLDVGRDGMLQDRVRAYAERAFEGEPWKDVMQGRRTVYSTYL